MSSQRPPTIDPVAAARWHRTASSAHGASPWLHEEVARRMQDRLQWLRQAPAAWCHWDAVRGGLEAHSLVSARYPAAHCQVYETSAQCEPTARQLLAQPWWKPGRWRGGNPQFGPPADASVDMLWANMALHTNSDPQALIQQWHSAIKVDGFLMFSCLGPDTLRELRGVYQAMGWPPAGHAFTDMHDWGDMLLHAGFAEPVMDMERITLTFATPQRLVQELRELGCNLHPDRFPSLRGKHWRNALYQVLSERLADPDQQGQLVLTFEVIYGHAFKPVPRVRLAGDSAVSLQDMRAMLKRG